MGFSVNISSKELVFIGRLAVLLVSVISVILTYNKNATILVLVGYTWAGFGFAFGPVILPTLYCRRMNKWGALAGMIVGASTGELVDRVHQLILYFSW